MKYRLLAILCLTGSLVYPCTDFVVETGDGTCINGRSMEFGQELRSSLIAHPRGEQRFTRGPSGKKTIKWTTKYGYVGADAFGLDTVVDGMNEAGLSIGVLLFPSAEYLTISPKDEQKAMDYLDFASWILGNFSTAAEVKDAIQDIKVWGHPVTASKIQFPVHLAVHDPQGNNLVIEFIKGEMKVHENSIGVLTNYPPFDWMVINLQNYINLSAANAAPIDLKGTVLGGTGQGSGMYGIPGDWTPPSRFVRITTFIRFAHQAPTALAGINLAEHLLNTVDIPIGVVREDDKNNSHEDYTQWILIKDLNHKMIYFRSYKDLCLKSIDLSKVNFNPGAPRTSVRIDYEEGILDLSDKMK